LHQSLQSELNHNELNQPLSDLNRPLKTDRIAVGMSGGVDSSVAAYLLKKQGYDVIGLYMKNWDETNDDGTCSAEADYHDVMKVCHHLDIPYYTVNFVNEYWDKVFAESLAAFKQGITPNPDILCNREIKFDLFLSKALSLGAKFLATGHYCQISHQNNHHYLLKGADPDKDQSYFLCNVKEEALKRSLFPIGNLKKTEVRAIAQEAGLTTFNKKDSTGICFIGERNFPQFLRKFIALKPGPIKTLEGETLGTHQGLAFYTIGQRGGLELGGGSSEPYYISSKDQNTNSITVVKGSKHPALYANSLIAHQCSWINSTLDKTYLNEPLKAKIRYRQADQVCTISEYNNDQIKVIFDKPQRAITPGQSIVFYKENTCLGGAIISCAI